MRINTVLLFAATIAISVLPVAYTAEEAKPADAEAQARAAYEAALKAAKDAEAALGPLREAMQKADTEYAKARQDATNKRRKATENKNLAGEQGVTSLKQAEEAVPAAIKALEEATKAKPPLDKALAEAKTAAAPLQEAYDAAEKVAKEAEAKAKAAQDAANRLQTEAKLAEAAATASRRGADSAKAAYERAQQGEKNLQERVANAAQTLAEAQKQQQAADAAVAEVKKQVTAATEALAAAEKSAQDAEAKAKQVSQDANKPEAEKKQATDDAAAKRQAAEAAKAALAKANAALQEAETQAEAAAQKVAQATAKKQVIESAAAGAKKQVAAAAEAAKVAEQAAQAAAKTAEEKKQAVAQAAAKLKAATDAAAALAEAQKAEQQAQAQAKAAAQKLAEAEAQKKAADNDENAKKVGAAQAQKKAADEALAKAKERLAAATAANQAAHDAAKDLIQLQAAAKQTAADAAAKRKVANEARAALAPKAKALEQATLKANAAAQALVRAQQRKESAEKALENLKKRIASAKETHVADEKAATEAEAAAEPLKAKAEKTRETYLAARDVANQKRALAEQAKGKLYRIVAAKRIAAVMESPQPAKPTNQIDELVFTKLKTMGIEPALCSDPVFIRRAYLDLTATLPSAEEAESFIKDPSPNKRVALIDRLLDQYDHVDYWAMRWSDILRIKAEFPVKVWPNAAQAYHRWVWESIAENKPYDQFVRELLTSSGSNFRVGAVNFYRAIQNNTPEGISAAVALALMGTRVHSWPEERRDGMAVFFSQVGYKPTSEWKEEIVFWDPLNSTAVPGSTAAGIDDVAKSVEATNQIPKGLDEPLKQNGPLTTVFPDGTKTTIPSDRDPREVFADWLIRPENPWFAKAIVNRTWAWAMGRGIIHEPDDIRDDNPPSNPELLAYLEKELVSSGYDLKHIKRLIFTSTTYQLSPIPKVQTPEAKANFASYMMRRVEAELLNDALNQITGSSDLYTSAVPEPFTYIPDEMSAVELADGSISSSFLTLFGRSARATGMENERVSELASPQWLHMLNSGQVQQKLLTGPKLKELLASGGQPVDIVKKLYLTILSRYPTDAELQAAKAYADLGIVKGRDIGIDLAWALINSPEFLLRH